MGMRLGCLSIHRQVAIPFVQLMTLTLFALIIGAIFFQLGTDELGFTNRYDCVFVTGVIVG